MYTNGRKQLKRIVRKLCELTFDLELSRSTAQEMQATAFLPAPISTTDSDVDWAQELHEDLDSALEQLTQARDLAKNLADEAKASLGQATSPPSSPAPANETGPVNKPPSTPNPFSPKEKHKGG